MLKSNLPYYTIKGNINKANMNHKDIKTIVVPHERTAKV
jgi:hypothetical protein